MYNYIECSSPVSVIKEEATFLVRQNVTMYTGIPVQGLNFQYKKKNSFIPGPDSLKKSPLGYLFRVGTKCLLRAFAKNSCKSTFSLKTYFVVAKMS